MLSFERKKVSLMDAGIRYLRFIVICVIALGLGFAGGCGGGGGGEESGSTPGEPTSPSRREAIPQTAVKMTPALDLFPPILHSDQWEEPVPVHGAINTAGAEDSPFVTPDGNTLYFFFTPDVSVAPELQVLDRVIGIYVATRQNGSWVQDKRMILQDPGKLALDG